MVVTSVIFLKLESQGKILDCEQSNHGRKFGGYRPLWNGVINSTSEKQAENIRRPRQISEDMKILEAPTSRSIKFRFISCLRSNKAKPSSDSST